MIYSLKHFGVQDLSCLWQTMLHSCEHLTAFSLTDQVNLPQLHQYYLHPTLKQYLDLE